MKFILHRDPDSKSQKIPYAALQISALAGAAELAVEAGTATSSSAGMN